MLTFTGKTYMDVTKQKRLEEKGWKFGSVQEFLYLTEEEREIIDNRLRTTRINKAAQENRKTKSIPQEGR